MRDVLVKSPRLKIGSDDMAAASDIEMDLGGFRVGEVVGVERYPLLPERIVRIGAASRSTMTPPIRT